MKVINPQDDLIFDLSMPNIISLGNQFILKFHLSSHTIYQNIHCNIATKSAFTLSSSSFTTIISALEQQTSKVELINLLSKQSRIELNDSLTYSISDINGVGQIIFEFKAGKSDEYLILCNSKQDSIIYTNIFYLYNLILNI